MPVRVSEEELKHVKSGTAVRFTAHILLDDAGEWGVEIKGCMAFRNGKGDIEIRPPVVYLNLYGKRIKFFPTTFTPNVANAIRTHIETDWGAKLAADPDWNGEREAAKRKWKDDGGFGNVESLK